MAERDVGLREHLQRERDDAVTADDDERVHPAFECALDEASRMLGVGARDRDDVDPALVQLGDRPLGRMRRAAVPRCGIGQHRDSAPASSRNQLAGVEDSGRIERRLDGPQHLDAESPTSSRIHGR